MDFHSKEVASSFRDKAHKQTSLLWLLQLLKDKTDLITKVYIISMQTWSLQNILFLFFQHKLVALKGQEVQVLENKILGFKKRLHQELLIPHNFLL
jgi:hypothetical protein